jgi:hypothetical protein
LDERGLPVPKLSFETPPCPLDIAPSVPYVDHIKWVSDLTDAEVELGSSWLQSIVDRVCVGERARENMD